MIPHRGPCADRLPASVRQGASQAWPAVVSRHLAARPGGRPGSKRPAIRDGSSQGRDVRKTIFGGLEHVPCGIRSLASRPLACKRVAGVDAARRASTGGGRPALRHSRELAIAWITPIAALEAIASRDSGREGCDRGQNHNDGGKGEKTAHWIYSRL